MNWSSIYDDFLRAPTASMIPVVQDFKRKMAALH